MEKDAWKWVKVYAHDYHNNIGGVAFYSSRRPFGSATSLPGSAVEIYCGCGFLKKADERS